MVQLLVLLSVAFMFFGAYQIENGIYSGAYFIIEGVAGMFISWLIAEYLKSKKNGA